MIEWKRKPRWCRHTGRVGRLELAVGGSECTQTWGRIMAIQQQQALLMYTHVQQRQVLDAVSEHAVEAAVEPDAVQDDALPLEHIDLARDHLRTR